jgi:hypothetical protein
MGCCRGVCARPFRGKYTQRRSQSIPANFALLNAHRVQRPPDLDTRAPVPPPADSSGRRNTHGLVKHSAAREISFAYASSSYIPTGARLAGTSSASAHGSRLRMVEGYYPSARGRTPCGRVVTFEGSQSLNASAVASCRVVPRVATSIFTCCSKSGSKRAENCARVVAPTDVGADLDEVVGSSDRVACSMK